MTFKDHFSGHAGSYARYRPDYPAELFDYLASLVPRHDLAVDCATGSGQAAIGLARHFGLVVASDGSVPQLRSAQPHPDVVYVGNLAEQMPLRDASADLVVAAQAAHWFDHERFNREVRRVLRPQGAVAIWAYDVARIQPDIDAVIHHYYADVVGPYWPPERSHVETAYRDLPFPWRDITTPVFQLDLTWDLDALMGYIGTWSATQRFVKATGTDPLPALRERLAAVWNSPATQRSVIWPLHLRVGQQ
jgi:SAM-dependent methyltransferase